jgi:hypothetical protein
VSRPGRDLTAFLLAVLYALGLGALAFAFSCLFGGLL